MRAFIAIPINKECLEKLTLLQNRLISAGADVKWVRPKNIHITLKFLGDIDEDRLQNIIPLLHESIIKHNSFNITIAGLGAFPSIKKPKTLWAGIDKGKKCCCLLQKDIESSVKDLGFDSENRPFKPHLTIGRVRSKKNILSLSALLEKEKVFQVSAESPVREVILFKSELTQKGPIYTASERFRMRQERI